MSDPGKDQADASYELLKKLGKTKPPKPFTPGARVPPYPTPVIPVPSKKKK